LRQKVIAHLTTMSGFHRELVESLPDQELGRKLYDRSNTVGAQMWCVVGARESYTAAIESDGWIGFSCSLTGSDTTSKDRVVGALAASESRLEDVIGRVEWTDTRENLLLDLLEHETQHQGQLIRYLYAMGHQFPESWAARWALDQPE